MGNIIKFPTNPEVEWRKVENTYRSWFGSQGCSEKVIDSLCISLKSHFMELGNSLDFSYTLKIPKGMSSKQEQEMRTSLEENLAERLNIFINEFLAAVLMRIGLLEIQLYEANHRKD